MNQHFGLVIGETQRGDYRLCDKCGNKTMLISAPQSWSVDEEPYKADERIEHEDGCVDIRAEVTAHFCEECEIITALSFNQRV